MRYLALCTDYDGTLATDGRVLPDTVSALERLLASGRRLVLVTGRELDQLQEVCPRLDLFEYVVAENGALLYQPSTGNETPLAAPPPASFVSTLKQRGVGPISVGRVIVATWEPHETTVLAAIRDLGLELQVIFNKGAVMILPAGVTKASGLAHALERMEISPHNAIAIGDAENDHALLASCECGVAVANALPTLKSAADLVTVADHGAGVVELIDKLLTDDLASLEPRLTRHHVLLGTDDRGAEVRIAPHGETALLVGTSGSGKTALATGLMERLAAQGYTFCVIDVAGRYERFGKAVALGSPTRPPTASEIVKLFQAADQSGVVNLLGLQAQDRLPFLKEVAPQLTKLRLRLGRPHWTVIDDIAALLPTGDAATGAQRRESREAPAARQPERSEGNPEKRQRRDTGRGATGVLPLGAGDSVLHITTRPTQVAREVLRSTSLFIAMGASRHALLEEFCRVSGINPPAAQSATPNDGAALAWRPKVAGAKPFRLNIAAPHREPSGVNAPLTSAV